MIVKSNSIILASDLSPAFLPQGNFAQYKKGFYPLAIVNNLSFEPQNSRSRTKQLSSQSFSQEALQYSPIVNLSFNYVTSLSFENDNLLNFFFRANEFFESNFKNANSYAANLYFLVSDLEYYDFINRIVSKGNLNGVDAICFGNCYLNSYSLSLPSAGLPVSSVEMQAVNMEMKKINGNTIIPPSINLSVGNQESGCLLLLETGSFVQNLQRLNTATGNFPILPTKNSTYFQISTENLQVPSTAFAPFNNCAIDSLELSFGIDRENSYGFGSDFIYDSKIKFPILGSLNVNLVNLNFNTGEGTLTGVMKNESGYNLEMTFSGINSPAKTLKISNAKLNSHSYSIDYSNYLTSSFGFDFQCNEFTGVSSKWSYVQSLSGVLFSNETQKLLDVNGSGLLASGGISPTPPTTPPPTTPPPTTPPPSPPTTTPSPSPPPTTPSPSPPPTTPPPSPPTTPAPPPPSPPVGSVSFGLSVGAGPSVVINWSVASNADNYYILRSEDGVSFTQIYSTSLGLTYTDYSVLGGGVGTPNYYYYYMVASNNSSSYTSETQNIGVE